MRSFICRIISVICALSLCVNSYAESAEIKHTNFADPAREMPAILNNSWIGLSMGYKKTDFQTSDFTSGYKPTSIKDCIVALRATLGHYFNPYFSVTLNLLRGAHSNKIHYLNGTYSVAESLFALTARPTLPLNDHFALFAEGGMGMISRRGFEKNTVEVVSNTDIFTGVLGGGFYLNLPENIFLDFEVEYSPRRDSVKQPSIVYVAGGLNYLLKDTHSHIQHGQQLWFPKSTMQLDYVNGSIFYADVAKYFTTPKSIPIFFDGSIKVYKGTALTYEKTFFHTYKYFSIEWGWSLSSWQSSLQRQDFWTASLFPEIKVWIIRSKRFDFYFTYSLAGPSYISRVYIDSKDSGSHFTFQDFLGFGAFFGKSKRIGLDLRIVHYSNGNSLPDNPGVAVPVMLGLVVSF